MNWRANVRVSAIGVVAIALVIWNATSRRSAAGPQSKSNRESQDLRAPLKPVLHLILVGCSDYADLRRPNLKGPPNDCELIHRVVGGQPGFERTDVVILSETAGGNNRPVYQAIERELLALAGRVHKGDEVVILLAGHGSRQPDLNDPPRKFNGLEEVFLPSDVGVAAPATGLLPNAITGAVLGQWVSAITNQGAHVFLILDACYSGNMLRGDAETSRGISENDLIPANVLQAARERGQRAFPQGRGERVVRQETKTALAEALRDSVVLYASQSDEAAPELEIGPEHKTYGLLSYVLCQLLEQSKGGQTITYRELGQLLQAKYLAMGQLAGPTPFVEGTSSALDREVLGSVLHLGRSRIVVRRNSDHQAFVNVGRLHGLGKGSILAVYPPPGRADSKTLVGYAVVTQSDILESQVAPVSYDHVAESPLPERGVCSLVKLDFGELRIPVAVDDGGNQSTEQAPAYACHLSTGQRKTLSDLRERLAKLTSDAPFVVTADLTAAKWVVQYRNNLLSLLPKDAAQAPETAALPAGTPVFSINEKSSVDDVAGHIRKVAPGQNLLDLVSSIRLRRAATRSSPPARVQLDLLKYDGPAPPAPNPPPQGTVIQPSGRELELHPGEFVGFRVKNAGRVPVYVTLLFVDSAFSIQAIYPKDAAENNLLTLPVDGQAPVALTSRIFEVNRKTVGHEHLIMIAVRAEPGSAPVDFTSLQEPTLDRAERSIATTRGDGAPDPFASPLGKLLRQAAYPGEREQSALTVNQLDDVDADITTWNVVDQR